MGFWKVVSLTMSETGLSKEDAISIVATEMYGTEEAKKEVAKKEAIALADIKLNTMP